MEIADQLIDAVICGKILLQKTKWEISFICNFCEKNLSTLPELLRHALSEHVEDATADKLEKLCGIEDNQEIDVKSTVCDMLKETIDRQEQEEMDEELLKHFMNKMSNNNNEHHKSEIRITPIEISDFESVSDHDNVDDDADVKQSNTKFEFLDVEETNDDNSESESNAVLPTRECKILTMLQCETCKLKFHRDKQLREHKKTVHGENPFVCNECGRNFTEKRCLSLHEMRHKGIKPHACRICGRTFTTSFEVVLHMRLHTGERPHKCSYCNKKFATSAGLTTHTRTHTKERTHLCPICGVKFSSSSMLKSHITTHSLDRPFKCAHCSANFKNRNGLRQHMLIHSDMKKYACQICFKTFAQQAGVYSHIKSAHKLEKKKICQLIK